MRTMRPEIGGTVVERKSGRPKLHSLQILRFVAAFSVVLFHLGATYKAEFGMERNIFLIGSSGVDIFFVISGFIIAYTADPDRGPLHFVWRRIVRIVPLYWTLTFGLAAIALLMPRLLNSTVVDAESLLKSLFFIPYEASSGDTRPILFLGWTLNYEMFFYALYALCIETGFRSSLAPLVLVLTVVAAGRLFEVDNVVWEFYTNPIILEFALGIVLCILYRRYTDVFAKSARYLILTFIAAFTARLALPGMTSIWANAIVAAVLVAAVLTAPAAKTPLSSLLVLLGDASYSLYLSHPYVFQLWIKASPERLGVATQLVMGAITSVGAVAVSVALYRLLSRRDSFSAGISAAGVMGNAGFCFGPRCENGAVRALSMIDD
ncbi:acyltransferase family protein [Sinorhizobium psoraleae]|uniref:acyltransferase family protein n=1 Tax=Sinorhizobium psoraleae TaxID=520838 RepID=UPI00156A1649|nr:acyltransferase [Sinorhizobium psoraleae]